MTAAKSIRRPRRSFTLERILSGALEDVWELLTTKDGFESWWGPKGFTTRVQKLDAVPGGEFVYELTVTDPDLRKGIEEAGLPLVSVAHGRITEVVPYRRLGFVTVVDFVPGVPKYETATMIDLVPQGPQIRLVVTLEALHNAKWTRLARLGWVGQLDRLSKLSARLETRDPKSSEARQR